MLRKIALIAFGLGLGLLAVDMTGQGLPPSFRVNGQSPGGTVTTPILYPDGTAAAPSIAFASETALGFRRTGAQTAYFADNASATVLGIGPATSTTGLQVAGGGAGTAGVTMGSGSAVTWTNNTEQSARDAFLRHTAAKTLQFDTDGAGGALTLVNIVSPITATLYQTTGSGMAVANVGANSCGTTTATIAGNNNVFVITVGTVAGTQCRVAFTVAATTEWDCTAADDTTTVAVRTTPVDTTHTDLIGTFTAGDKVTGICFPR